MHRESPQIPAPPRFPRAPARKDDRRNRRAARAALLLGHSALPAPAYVALAAGRESRPIESALRFRVPRSHALGSMPQFPKMQFVRIAAVSLHETLRLLLNGWDLRLQRVRTNRGRHRGCHRADLDEVR